jgi:hypothetical protein
VKLAEASESLKHQSFVKKHASTLTNDYHFCDSEALENQKHCPFVKSDASTLTNDCYFCDSDARESSTENFWGFLTFLKALSTTVW